VGDGRDLAESLLRRRRGTPMIRVLRSLLLILCVAVIGATPTAFSQVQDQMRTAATSVVEQLTVAQKRTVAVVDFTDQSGRVNCLGRLLADELSTVLASQRRSFTVVERAQLKRVLEEQKLASTGVIDPGTASRVGKIAGAEAIIYATLTATRDNVRVLIKVTGTERGEVVGSVAADVPLTKTIEDLIACSTTAPPVGAAKTPSPLAKPQAVSQGGILYTLQGCVRQVASVLCKVQLEHGLSRDQDVSFGPVRRIDTNGPVVAVSLEGGGQRGQGYNWIRVPVLAGLPTVVQVLFDAFQSDQIPILELESNRTERNGIFVGVQTYRVQFRKVVIQEGQTTAAQN
jgi:TolB-like protein